MTLALFLADQSIRNTLLFHILFIPLQLAWILWFYLVQMKTILIVEDDQFTCFLLREAFALFSKDHTVRVAGDGGEALGIMEKEQIDVILTDIMMPVMDGFELIAAVRSRNRDIPIYVMTSYSPSLMEERLKGLDITGYFPKPYDLQTMISLIKRGPLPKDGAQSKGRKEKETDEQ